MKNKLLFSAIIFVLSFISLVGCAKTEKSEPFITFTDSVGNEVVLHERPKNVAVLFSSFADMWRLAGGDISVTVGESVERGICEPSVLLVDKGAGKSINLDLLISYKPDLVICSADIAAQSSLSDILEAADIPCANFRVESFSDYLSVLDTMTDITGNKEAYELYGTSLKERIDTLISNITQENKKSILFIRAGTTAKATKAKRAEDHFAAKMLEQLGAYNIADNAEILLDGLSVEEILRADPDYIFITTMGDEELSKAYMDSLLSDTVWQSLSAVKNKNYYYLPKELFQFKPNGRWYEAYYALWEILYEN